MEAAFSKRGAAFSKMEAAFSKKEAAFSKRGAAFSKMEAAFSKMEAAQKRPRPWDVSVRPAFSAKQVVLLSHSSPHCAVRCRKCSVLTFARALSRARGATDATLVRADYWGSGGFGRLGFGGSGGWGSADLRSDREEY